MNKNKKDIQKGNSNPNQKVYVNRDSNSIVGKSINKKEVQGNFFKKNEQILPEISSPFLKKTVYQLFSQNKLPSLTPIIRYCRDQQNSLSKKINQSVAQNSFQNFKTTKNNSQNIQMSSQFHILGETNNKQKTKITKCFSLSKPTFYYVSDQANEPEQSIQLKESRMNLKTLKNRRITTEESNHHDESSGEIYEKIDFLKEKETCFNENSKKIEGLSKVLQNKSSFLMKHKLVKQLYNQQREQIKFVKELMGSHVGANLSKMIKVKNYTKFFPRIMKIET